MSDPRYEMNIYWSDEDAAYVVEIPELPGCAADGATYEEAVANARVIIDEWIETARELGRPIPERATETGRDTSTSPEMLYKYRALDSELTAERVRQTIVDSILYWSSPADFNDPFDCQIEFTGSTTDWEEFLARSFQRSNPNVKYADIMARVTENIKRGPAHLQQLAKDIQADLQRDANKVAILSLSARKDQIAMWSYYADSHKGVCLGFRQPWLLADPEKPEKPRRVQYSDYLPEAVASGSDLELVAPFVTKARTWQHEEEYRIVDYRNEPGKRAYEPDLLAEVILGISISEYNRDRVLAWADLHHPKPRVFQAIKQPGAFAIDVEELGKSLTLP